MSSIEAGGGVAKIWSYLITLFNKNDDEGEVGGQKSQKIDDVFYEWPFVIISFFSYPRISCCPMDSYVDVKLAAWKIWPLILLLVWHWVELWVYTMFIFYTFCLKFGVSILRNFTNLQSYYTDKDISIFSEVQRTLLFPGLCHKHQSWCFP